MYVEIDFEARSRVKIEESIAVVPSEFVTDHVRVPHNAVVQPLPVQLASVSDQLRIAYASLTLYVKAGLENFVELILSTSVRHGLFTITVNSLKLVYEQLPAQQPDVAVILTVYVPIALMSVVYHCIPFPEFIEVKKEVGKVTGDPVTMAA